MKFALGLLVSLALSAPTTPSHPLEAEDIPVAPASLETTSQETCAAANNDRCSAVCAAGLQEARANPDVESLGEGYCYNAGDEEAPESDPTIEYGTADRSQGLRRRPIESRWSTFTRVLPPILKFKAGQPTSPLNEDFMGPNATDEERLHECRVSCAQCACASAALTLGVFSFGVHGTALLAKAWADGN